MFKKIVQFFKDIINPPRIKGNIHSNGRKIYHVPSGRFYDNVKAEVMFRTEEEAISAGFKKSKQ